ncbi:MAG: bifunctional pantoate--beta-alanine ligase/(d)CMP kinase [Cyanobacteriota bacterium]
MRLLQTRPALHAWLLEDQSPPAHRHLHFVPTMGALHPGHQALIARAAQPRGGRQPRVLVSVFVNPRQFAADEDLERYPRQLEADVQLATAAGAEALYAPSVEDLYPGGEAGITRVCPPPDLLQTLCARQRPGHFDGVATVVCRLLALVRPDRLFLGEKDWQQLVILRRVIRDLALPLTVEGVATVRESDGLALSSRNRYLDAAQRLQAAALPSVLAEAADEVAAAGAVRPGLQPLVASRLAAAGLAPEYVEVVEPHTLRPHQGQTGLALLAVAVTCGQARLIDHRFLMTRSPIVAIDGPAGAGKSTVTRAFADRLGLVMLDTGAMYRAVTWWVRERGADPADEAAVAPLLKGLDLQLSRSDQSGEQIVTINGHDVTSAIRSPEVTALVSVVAAHPCVRAALTAQQQRLGARGGLVAEGRDIGTAVFPDAELKVFLTATVGERARRRAADLAQRGFAVPPLEELEAQIAERDHLDSTRAVAPLCQAEDAEELITDGLAIDAVIQRLVDLFRERVPEEAWPARASAG